MADPMTADELAEMARLRRYVRSGRARELRIRAGLSLREVAAVVGVPDVTVLRWERGERVPRLPAALNYWHLLQRLNRQQGRGEK